MTVGLLSFCAPSPPSGVALTALPTTGGASAGVQRDISLTTGSPSFSGTYSGGLPTGFQGRIRKVSDNSTVTDWTTLTNVSFGGGTFSGKMAGVPQGSGYYRDVRCLNATSVTATDLTPFMIGIGLACYGQSNMGAMFTAAASPPAASASTAYFNGTNWAAVPSANGIRELLNAVASATSVPVFACNASMGGANITVLSKGDASGYYTALIAQITAMGGAEFLLWRQGETYQFGISYSALLDTLHDNAATDTGRTKTTMRLVVSSLATSTSGLTDASWSETQSGLLAAAGQTGGYYSHSNMDAVLVDTLHEDAANCGKSGKRFAQTINTVLGSTSGYPKWSIASAASVDGTHTDVTVTHNMGTDFTPTSGITGFEASGDSGSTWVTPSAAVRQSATVIRLTHSSIATGSTRRIRYQYGINPDISGIALDNSALAVPLLMSDGNVAAP